MGSIAFHFYLADISSLLHQGFHASRSGFITYFRLSVFQWSCLFWLIFLPAKSNSLSLSLVFFIPCFLLLNFALHIRYAHLLL